MSYRTSHVGKAGETYDQDLDDGGFDSYMSSREAAILSRLVQSPLVPRHDRYLDFACGSGRITSLLSPHFRTTVGVDLSADMIQAAVSKVPEVEFKLCDITQDAVELGQFDLITAFRFFGNAEDQLRRDVISSLKGLLKPDGALVINNHRNPSSLRCRLSRDSHGMDFTYAKTASIIAECGLRIRASIPVGAWMLRHKWSDRSVWDSRLGRALDACLTSSLLSRFSPDMVIVAGLPGKSS